MMNETILLELFVTKVTSTDRVHVRIYCGDFLVDLLSDRFCNTTMGEQIRGRCQSLVIVVDSLESHRS